MDLLDVIFREDIKAIRYPKKLQIIRNIETSIEIYFFENTIFFASF
jgi:hypothetical protein